ncbi:MAG: hypothetical protein Q4D79_09330 [Propionibacteriaceae bacterium]|nr:hypothetical protein [Propionibacteriaceae bacterium]
MTLRLRMALASVFVGALALSSCSQTPSAQESPSGQESSAVSSSSQASSPSPAQSSAAAEIPAGYQEITAPTAKISVAVPEDWVNFDDLTDEQIEAVASEVGMSPEQYKQSLTQLDVFYRAPAPDAQDFTTNLNIAKRAVVSAPPTEDETVQVLQQQNCVLDSYEQVQTANGAGVAAAYTLSAGSVQSKGNMLFLPNADGAITTITISASTPEAAKEIADVVVKTAH